MAIEFVQRGKLGDGWRMEAQKAGVVIGVIAETTDSTSSTRALTPSWARTPCYDTPTSKG